MSGKHLWRCLGIALVAGILAISFQTWDFSTGGSLLAQEQPGAPAGNVVEPECSFFRDFQQHHASGPAGLERRPGWQGGFERLRQVSMRTELVAGALTPLSAAAPTASETSWLSPIDSHILTALQQQGIPPAARSTDAEFLRRVTIDLTGRIPTVAQVQEFLADTDPQKRARAIDRLLDSPEWVDRWTMWLGDLLKNNSASTQINRGPQGRTALHEFIKRSLQQNKPYNQLVAELITGTGESFVSGPANFIVGGRMSMGPPQDTYDRQWVQSATMFLGLKNFDCLLCHNGAGHLDAVNLWASQVKRSEAWGMAAFFSRARIQRPGGNGTTYVVSEAPRGGYNLNTTSGNRPARAPSDEVQTPVLPRYMFSGRQVSAEEDFRSVLAQELTGDLQFARATVNFLWEHFFGIGIVDPPDAFDLARLDPNNPPPEPWTLQPSHPELLEFLARDFVSQGYDLKELMRAICNSRTYQLSSRYSGTWEDEYARYFARHLIRRLDAEELADAVVQSSGVPNSMAVPLGDGNRITVSWAMQLPETSLPRGPVGAFLDSFLRGDRDENVRSGELSTAQSLALMNDEFILSRVQRSTAPGGQLAAMLASGLDNARLAEAIYLATLSRYPTEEELIAAVQTFQSGSREARAQDLLWTLYNKVDFVFNY
jgi:hypothetical protein